ncbi:MAG: zf-HC2 domain-containing protein [Anaerolineaceae bacterium]
MNERFMNEHVTAFLSGYVDGELSAETSRAVKAHLAVCPQCRGQLEQMHSLSRLLGGVPRPVSQPQQFAALLQARLPQRKETGLERIFNLIWALFPGGLALGWGLLQAVFVTAFLLSVVIAAGVFPQMGMYLPQASSSLLNLLLNPPALSGPLDLAGFVWQLFTVEDAVLQGLILYIVLNAGLAALFAAWMAGWFLSKRRASLQ